MARNVGNLAERGEDPNTQLLLISHEIRETELDLNSENETAPVKHFARPWPGTPRRALRAFLVLARSQELDAGDLHPRRPASSVLRHSLGEAQDDPWWSSR